MPEKPGPPDLSALLENARWVRGLAMQLVRDSHVADDVVQQAWLAAVGNPPDAARGQRAWLRRVIRNLAARTHRDRRLRSEHEPRAARPDPVPSPHELVELAEQQHRVVQLVVALDEP